MTKRIALIGLFLSMTLIGASYAAAFMPGGAPVWASWVMSFGTAGVMVSVLLLGAAKRINAFLAVVFVLTFFSLAGGFAAALRAPIPNAAARMWLGLPAGAAIILYIVGLLPMLLLPVAYALTFDDADERA